MSKRTYYKRDELGRFAKENYSSLSANELSEKLKEQRSEPKRIIPVTPITDKAIENVPVVEIPGYTHEECEKIAQQHKELLKYARDKNNNNEVAFVFRKGLQDKSIYEGAADEIDLGYALSGKGEAVVILHNHPRNKSFSLRDVNMFISVSEIKTLTVVKNNGAVEIITKNENFDSLKAKLLLTRNYKRNTNVYNDSEYEKTIKQTLSNKESGILWIKK